VIAQEGGQHRIAAQDAFPVVVRQGGQGGSTLTPPAPVSLVQGEGGIFLGPDFLWPDLPGRIRHSPGLCLGAEGRPTTMVRTLTDFRR
jgi:hypothetical protein